MLKVIFSLIAFAGIYLMLWALFQNTGGGVG